MNENCFYTFKLPHHFINPTCNCFYAQQKLIERLISVFLGMKRNPKFCEFSKLAQPYKLPFCPSTGVSLGSNMPIWHAAFLTITVENPSNWPDGNRGTRTGGKSMRSSICWSQSVNCISAGLCVCEERSLGFLIHLENYPDN